MLDLPIEVIAQLNKRTGVKIRNLVWFKAKNRSTGVTETLGIWNGEDVEQFVIGGEARGYVGGGGFIQLGNLKQEIGLTIRRLSMVANPVSPEILNLLRLYEPRNAPVEVHMAFFDPETNNLLADPVRIFKGWINGTPIKTPEKNGKSTVTIEMVGNSRLLTRLSGAKRSDENQRKRVISDGFFKSVNLTGTIQTPWGSKLTAPNNYQTMINHAKYGIYQ